MDPNLLAILIYSLAAICILIVLPLLIAGAILRRIVRAFVNIVHFLFGKK